MTMYRLTECGFLAGFLELLFVMKNSGSPIKDRINAAMTIRLVIRSRYATHNNLAKVAPRLSNDTRARRARTTGA